MKKIVWILPLLGSLLGGLVGVATALMADSSPKEAAGFALACALALIPYVLARSIGELTDNESLAKNMATLTRMVAESQGKLPATKKD